MEKADITLQELLTLIGLAETIKVMTEEDTIFRGKAVKIKYGEYQCKYRKIKKIITRPGIPGNFPELEIWIY